MGGRGGLLRAGNRETGKRERKQQTGVGSPESGKGGKNLQGRNNRVTALKAELKSSINDSF